MGSIRLAPLITHNLLDLCRVLSKKNHPEDLGPQNVAFLPGWQFKSVYGPLIDLPSEVGPIIPPANYSNVNRKQPDTSSLNVDTPSASRLLLPPGSPALP